MEIKITFPGGKKVNAEFNGMTVKTDQPVKYGGEGSAPSPFDYFLSSLGTCAGIYVLGFCEKRNIPTTGIFLLQRLEHEKKGEKVILKKIILEIHLPGDFPEKYREAVVKVANQCAVKKSLLNPPDIEMMTKVH